MGQIYELSEDDVIEIIDEIIQSNRELSDWCQEDERIREELEKIFYTQENDELENNYQNYEQEYYGAGKKAGLYFRDSNKHICVKSIVLDFIRIIFEPSTWECVKGWYCRVKRLPSEEITLVDGLVLIDKIRSSITKNIINLEKESFCFYLQMVTHFREHEIVTFEELLDWLPEETKACIYPIVATGCQFCENGQCMLKSKHDYQKRVKEILDLMAENRILLCSLNQNNKYKINY